MKEKINQIALLGTSADPPTNGHEALLKGLLTLFPKVVTWASDNPTKNHQASLNKRSLLLNTLVRGIANPHLELMQDLSSPWTITTLEKASNKWPKAKLIFVIGSDLIEQIPTWVDVKILLKKARIGITPRKGWPITKTSLSKIKSLGGQIELLPLQVPPTASSKARANLQTNQIPKAVLEILLKENLYSLKNSTR